jgi:hypothetical protein
MSNYSQQNDPAHNRNFNQLWESPYPPSLAEIELAELRAIHGNAAGAKIFRERLQHGQVRV